jgi:acetolactate synthase-1/2/3 large subunit
VVGDAKEILTEMLTMVKSTDRSVWLVKIKEWKEKFPLRYDQDTSTIKPQYVIESLGKLANGKAIVTTGVGQHQMWSAQFFNYSQPRQLLTSGGLGTMGFGLPAAIGAQIGRPDKIVIDIDGDSSFSMTLMELATVAQHKLPIKIALIRNTFQGMVRQWQELFYGKRYSYTEMVLPDFLKIAEGFGIKAVGVYEKDQVQDVIAEALKYPGPILMDFKVEPEENVWPIVAPSKALHEMELGRLA